MAIYRYGTFVEPTKSASSTITLNIGFIPSVFRMRDITVFTSGTVTGVIEGYFSQQLQATSTGSSLLYTYTTGAPVISVSTTNGITAFTTPDAELFLPAQAPYTTSGRVVGESTNLVITGISQAANASVTATHSFTTADQGVTVVTFHGNNGMTQINGLSGVIQTVTSTTSFTVNINSTNFTAWASGGTPIANVITGAPATTLYGNTNLPTAEANLGIIGLKIGTDFMNGAGSSTGDIWEWEAILQSPATGP